MEKLKVMYGSKERADEVRQWLKDQGAINVEGWECNSEGWLYYVFKGEARTAHSKDEMWDIVPHEIVELPQPEHQFQPFEKVLVRNSGRWYCDFFSHYDDNSELRYQCIGCGWAQCVPYEGNEHLLRTTDSPKGGEK